MSTRAAAATCGLAACATATFSGEVTSTTHPGFTLAGTTQNGSEDESGVLQFDGQGNVTASYAVTSLRKVRHLHRDGNLLGGQSNCLGTAILTDSSNVPNTMAFSVMNAYGQGVNVIALQSPGSSTLRHGACRVPEPHTVDWQRG